MEKRFRALGAVSSFFRVLAWIALLLGIVATIVVAAVGAIQAQRGVSDLLANVPILNQTNDVVPALLLGLAVLIVSLLKFVLLYGISEAIQVLIAIEQNTRETAYYLRGENQIPPPPPVPSSWEEQDNARPTSN
jgi:uncharacterized membrane protein YiaA